MEGSLETKLWSGIALKMEYEQVLGSNFEVQYLKKILHTHNINV
jgi:hypothetical protein